MYGDLIEDFFEASLDDFVATMEQIDDYEQQRDNAR
jgi:hypothetical protein